jgi:metal-dependent amidase/aminoacylase/carboxypeptidase family protein
MGKSRPVYDVLISHEAGDRGVARHVASICRENGLEPALDTELLASEDASDALWDAFAESRAMIAILPASGPTGSMTFEIGAAQAWNKPIYAVVSDPTTTAGLPTFLKRAPLYTVGRLQEVAGAIKASS